VWRASIYNFREICGLNFELQWVILLHLIFCISQWIWKCWFFSIVSDSQEKLEENKLLWNLAKPQWILLVVFGCNSFLRSASNLIIGPFYPSKVNIFFWEFFYFQFEAHFVNKLQAEEKGVSATQVGFIIGSFDFSVAISAFVFIPFAVSENRFRFFGKFDFLLSLTLIWVISCVS